MAALTFTDSGFANLSFDKSCIIINSCSDSLWLGAITDKFPSPHNSHVEALPLAWLYLKKAPMRP